MRDIPVGVQLYTLARELLEDYQGTLEEVARIGYPIVEIGGPPAPYTAREWRAVLARLGLSAISHHMDLDRLRTDLDRAIDFDLDIGVRYMTCPILSPDMAADEEAYRRTADFLNRTGRRCAERGLRFCYHNHSFEFVRFGDRFAYDLLIEETDPAAVLFEMDAYWVTHGGQDPAAYLRKLGPRCEILHLKDMEKGPERFFTEVGEGQVDFAALMTAAAGESVGTFIVEQDATRLPTGFDSIRTSLRNIGRIKQAIGMGG